MAYCYSVKLSDLEKMNKYESITGNHPAWTSMNGGFWYIHLKGDPPDIVQQYDSFEDMMVDIDDIIKGGN